MRKTRRILLTTALVATLLLAGLSSPGSAQREQKPQDHVPPPHVRLTWMSIANWLFETGDTQVLMDGYITRLPESLFTGEGTLGLDYTRAPANPDTEAIQRVFEALGGDEEASPIDKRIDYILTGHSNFDHSFDTAAWAKLTGAHIIGSQSTCFQAFAQGIPRTGCTIVDGGEVIELGDGLSVRVVRWNHSGDFEETADLHEPRELTQIPRPDPETGVAPGGLRAGILEDFPNGGGARGFLFTLDDDRGPVVSWFYADSGSPVDFDEPVIVDGTNYGAPRDNLIAAMKGAGVESVDLWLQNASADFVDLVAPLLSPDAFIPHHWDGLFEPFFPGLPFEFENPELERVLSQAGIELAVPCQYMDAWRLTADRLRHISNEEVKRNLGLSECQQF